MARNNYNGNYKGMSNFEIIAEMEELIKKFSKKPEKKEYKAQIVKLFQHATVILSVESDFNLFGIDEDTVTNVLLKPDVVKDSSGKRMLPVFTSLEQIPDDYAESFSLMRVSSRVCYNIMNKRMDVDGLVINPFSRAMPLIKRPSDGDIDSEEVKRQVTKNRINNTNPELFMIIRPAVAYAA